MPNSERNITVTSHETSTRGIIEAKRVKLERAGISGYRLAAVQKEAGRREQPPTGRREI